MKKFAIWFLVALFVLGVLALVYLFLIKGYSGFNSLAPTPTPATESESLSETPTEESQNITSNKISLAITSPKSGSTLSSTSLTVTGITTPGAEVFVNDQEGKANDKGLFSVKITLEEGENQIVVSANDIDGNVAEENLVVTVSTFE